MTLRPLGDRILIKPLPNEETTDSGLILVEHRKPETMGTVVAVGECAHPLKYEAENLAARLHALYDTSVKYEMEANSESQDVLSDSAEMLIALAQREPSVKVGDTVIFPWTAGREVHIDDGDERYLMMREADLLAVLE